MANTDGSFNELFNALVTEIEGVVEGLHLSNKIIDPTKGPQTRLNKVFSIEMQSSNTNIYRDRRDRRIRMGNEVIVRTAHRMNPKNEIATQQEAFADESNAIIQLMTTTEKPLCYTRIQYIRTRRKKTKSEEWLLTDILFDIQFDFELADSVV